ncbi:MAG: secondary thiamine-phosphate synthase enzyme YjbQ [Planctomycetota bacterium]
MPVRDVLRGDVETGLCTVFVEHTTAAIGVNENERRLRADTEAFLSELVPDSGHRHDELDDNADAHLRATLVGPGETIPVRDGRLALGTWQSILLYDFDGPRRRMVSVTVVEELPKESSGSTMTVSPASRL